MRGVKQRHDGVDLAISRLVPSNAHRGRRHHPHAPDKREVAFEAANVLKALSPYAKVVIRDLQTG
jgi:hypothetical protein